MRKDYFISKYKNYIKENSNQYKPCEIIGIFIKKYYNHSLINDLLLPRQHLGI